MLITNINNALMAMRSCDIIKTQDEEEDKHIMIKLQ